MKKSGMKRKAAVMMAAVLGMAPAMGMTSYGAKDRSADEVSRVWDFSDGTQGWVYDNSWAGDSYTGDGACTWDEERQMLKISLDYSGNVSNGWSQTGISLSESGGIDYAPYKVMSFDLYYDPAAFSTGQITVKADSGHIFTDSMANIHQAVTEDMEDGRKKVTMNMMCDTQQTKSEKPGTLMLLMIGNNTDYKGDIWLDNIKLSNVKVEKYLVDSTVKPETKTALSGSETALRVNGSEIAYAELVKLADPQADNSVLALYQYLKAVGESDSTLYGHMEDMVLKAGSSELSCSDTMDVTGSYSAIVGLDAGNLFAGYADKYNSRHPEAGLSNDNAGNIQAAARFSNEVIAEGGIITLSAHIPNFAKVPALGGTHEHTYDNYNYLATDSYVLTGNAMNQILPGGAYHEVFTAYLDMIADYANQVQGPVMFRPWHENTGSWFWWGKAFCSPETYKNVFKYTVEYLRDEKGVHNLMYLYGPGAEAATLEEYEERYPGDEYVDLVGFDTYDVDPVTDEEGYTFTENFDKLVKLTDTFAKNHGKLFAVTETGISSSGGKALPETGNKRPQWYAEILDILTKPEYDCCYFMLWSNYSRAGSYYTPFVEEINEDGSFFGHELLDAFIGFYNDERSVFAADQKQLVESMNRNGIRRPKLEAWSDLSGYITSPVSGSRILEETLLQARLKQPDMQVEFRIGDEQNPTVIPAKTKGKLAEAVLEKPILEAMGEMADGRIGLYAGETKLQEISLLFNIPPRPEDPFLVDDFESYAGLESLLSASWTSNKDSGCEFSAVPSADYAYDGEYSLRIAYDETKNGWAGCEFAKEADWSGCNALQFLVVPDQNHQRTVVQIKTEGGVFEAWLQEYPEYVNSQEPLLLTLPFEEFKDRNGTGMLTPELAASISGLGFWVNAIPDSEAIGADGRVKGELYYDAVRAGYVEGIKPTFEVPEPSVKRADTQPQNQQAGAEAAAGNAGGQTTETEKPFPVVPVASGAAALLALAGCIGVAVHGRKQDGSDKTGK
ncbi:MAG: glycosyl hydrolase [Eubacteriales bacterium]|nr:glycosyl hydrolase [Eubacteriales bacterium]